MTKEQKKIAEMADILHQASMLYMASNLPIDYGTGEKYTPVEVHMLKYIIDHPGKNVTELSMDWDRTKAAISQMLKRMEQKNLILWRTELGNNKKQLYYATEHGLKLHKLHSEYDAKVFGQTLDYLRETCTDDEIDLCFHVLKEYSRARRQKHYQSD